MKKIYFLVLSVILVSHIFAGDVSRKGTTGAEQLLIPVGARGIATGGAFLANLTGIESIFYNPAGLSKMQSTEAMFNYMTYFADVNLSYFAISAPIGDLGSFGLSFKTLEFGDIPITTSEFPDGTGTNYSPSYLVLGLTYSKIVTDRISIGTNIKIISEKIINTSATGFAIDAGVQYSFDNNLSIGASLKNIGANMKFSGSDLQQFTSIPGTNTGSPSAAYEVLTEEFQIPSFFELSLAYNLNVADQNDLAFASTFTANNALEDLLTVGVEYGYLNTFFLRGGYNYQLENSDQAIYNLTVGAGINYALNDEIDIRFDYAFRNVDVFPTDNHVFTIILSIE